MLVGDGKAPYLSAGHPATRVGNACRFVPGLELDEVRLPDPAAVVERVLAGLGGFLRLGADVSSRLHDIPIGIPSTLGSVFSGTTFSCVTTIHMSSGQLSAPPRRNQTRVG